MVTLSETSFSGIPSPSFEILEGHQYVHAGYPFWVIRLAVRTCNADVEGWAFVDPEFIELRFELEPDGEPPGFITGRYLLDAGDNNSLALLYENPSELVLIWVEESIKMFLENCLFCVKSLIDLSSGEKTSRVTSVRFKGETFPVLAGRRGTR